MHAKLRGTAAVCGLFALAACGASTPGPGAPGASSKPAATVAINVPSSADPYVAGVIRRGAQLAVDEANKSGFKVAGTSYTVNLKVYDDNNDPQQASANVAAAIQDGAVGVVEDGIGAAISASRSSAAGVPEIVITDGDTSLLRNRASVFRLGIPNDAAASVLGTYIASHAKSVAVLHDDTTNGRDGSTQLVAALQTAGTAAQPVIEVAANAPTLDAQIQQITAGNPGGIAIWGSDVFIAKAVNAIRSGGVTTPIYTSQAGESPTVRQLAGATNTEGIALVGGRMTSENDATSFGQFEQRLARDGLGPTDAGVKNAAGQEIRQPNDVDFFAYDAVRLILASLQKQGSLSPGASLLQTISSISITSANGDARGFDPQSHEAFADQDAYVAVIHDMQFEPAKDEKLSASLPQEDEILGDFHS